MRWPDSRFLACTLLCCLSALAFLLTACDSGTASTAVTPVSVPSPTLAGGEAVLPRSQIFLHAALLPTASDLTYDSQNWTLAGFDNADTRSIPLPGCCHGQPAPLWYQSLRVPVLVPPVVSNGLIYQIAADGYVHVLRARDGEEQWRVPVGGELTADGLATAHDMLYLALDGHYLAALDAATGRLRWRFDTVGVVRGVPLVVGPDVLVTSGANSIFCLNALTGEEYWAFHSEDALAQFWPTRTPPAVARGLVHVALGASNEFNALSLRTGRKVWEVNLHERMTGGPVLDEAVGLVYIVTWSGKVVAFDMQTGARRWSYQLASGSQSSPALSLQTGTLYLGDYNGRLYALDAVSGRLRWQVNMPGSINNAPLVLQGQGQIWLVVASQDGTCTILDAQTGTIVIRWQLGELRASPVAAQGVLYQASLGDRGLFAFRL
jgi:outer membrane protein assembly factor BamB